MPFPLSTYRILMPCKKERIFGVLDAAAQVAQPSIDITQYLVENRQPPNASTQGPAALLYLLNWFSKDVMKQLQTEAGADTKTANAIGILAIQVFSRPAYLFNGQSLIELLWAKFHKVCPTLFGIFGQEDTRAGRERVGWLKEGGAYLEPSLFYGRLAGLAAGFAAITLRDYSRSQQTNPAPNWIFWESMARILNTPANEVQPMQFVLVKAMIENSAERIIKIWGAAGVGLLRQALIAFPSTTNPALRDDKGHPISTVTAVQAMPTVLRRDLKLTL